MFRASVKASKEIVPPDRGVIAEAIAAHSMVLLCLNREKEVYPPPSSLSLPPSLPFSPPLLCVAPASLICLALTSQ